MGRLGRGKAWRGCASLYQSTGYTAPPGAQGLTCNVGGGPGTQPDGPREGVE